MEQLVSGEEKQRWEGERERLVARIKELQVAATLHLYTHSYRHNPVFRVRESSTSSR